MVTRKLLFILGVLLTHGFSLGAQAFVATEIDFNVIELRSSHAGGLRVTSLSTKRVRKKEWVYFCVGEGTTASVRCFYGLASRFQKLTLNAELEAVEYALRARVQNSRAQIPIAATDGYFYPALVLRRSP